MTSPFSMLFPPVPATESSETVGAALDQVTFAFLCVFIFSIPWAETLPNVGGLVLSRWLGLATCGLALLRSGVLGRARPFRELNFWMVAFAMWSATSILWTMDVSATAARTITYVQLIVLTWVIWIVAVNETRVQNLLQCYVLGTIVCAVGTIQNLRSGIAMGELAGAQAPTTDRYTITGINPNDMGMALALGIPITLYLLARQKGGRLGALVGWTEIVLSVTAILLSGSRGALLAAAAGLTMLPLVLPRLPSWQRALALGACVAAVAAGAFLVPLDTWKRFLSMGSEISEGTLTHRRQIWAGSMIVFSQHPLLGVGSGAHGVAIVDLVGRPSVAHNTFISVLAELGVIGGLILLGLLGAMVYAACRMEPLKRFLWLVAVGTWCVGVCDGTWEYQKITWLLFSLLAAHAYAQPAMLVPAMSPGRGNASLPAKNSSIAAI